MGEEESSARCVGDEDVQAARTTGAGGHSAGSPRPDVQLRRVERQSPAELP